eukprot:10988280-Ditylum_brightwellii.AAC.1
MDRGKLKMALKQMDKLGVDVIGFVETNTPWNPNERESVRQITNQIFRKKSKTVMSTSDIPCVASKQPGGVMTCVVGKQVGRIITTGID